MILITIQKDSKESQMATFSKLSYPFASDKNIYYYQCDLSKLL